MEKIIIKKQQQLLKDSKLFMLQFIPKNAGFTFVFPNKVLQYIYLTLFHKEVKLMLLR